MTETTEVDITHKELQAILKHLFRQWSLEEDVSIEDGLYACKMNAFVDWCNQKDLPARQSEELAVRLGVRREAIKAISEVFQGDVWNCAAILIPLWPLLVLQHRPPHQNAVKFIHVAFTTGYYDEQVLQLQGSYQLEHGAPLGDGFLVGLMSDMSRQMINTYAEQGMDKLHDGYAQPVADTVEERKPAREVPPPPPGQLGF